MAVLTLYDGKKKDPRIPEDITEDEMRYIYRNPEGLYAFTPMYEAYTDDFLKEIVSNTRIKTAYTRFTDTAWFEKYALNTYQFAAAKDAETCRLMQAQVYDETGKLRSFPQFRERANEISQSTNEVWLRVERDNCARQSIMSDKFQDMRDNADIYPYWMYKGRLDSRERKEHLALEGLICRIGSPSGDRIIPPGDWNCRCTAVPIDDRYLSAHNRSVQSDAQAQSWLEGKDDDGKPFVDPQFRYNPADQGMMPKQGRYFEDGGLRSANDGSAAFFGLGGTVSPELDGYIASMLPHLPAILADWRQHYTTDRLNNIIFQNPALLSNVWFTPHSEHQIHRHPKGVALLPQTVIDPSEVWMRWEDAEKQQVVLRNYLTFGVKESYLVQTRDGAIQDAHVVSRAQAERFRIGVPWIK